MSEQLEFNWLQPPQAPAPSASTAEKQAPLVWSEAAQIHAAAAVLHQELADATGLQLRLRITNNSSTIMSVRYSPDGASARVSLHHMFLRADAPVRRALVKWIKKPRARKSAEVLDDFIREQSHQIKPSPQRRLRLQVSGQHHDLPAIFNELNAQYFENSITARITWGKMPKLRRRYSIRFGSYAPKEDLIRMHPLLDQEFVPAYFVRYIVFHEMLHAYLGIEELPSGRRAIHTRDFKRLEQKYPDYQRALAWMRDPRNLDRFLQAHKSR